ncbi:MAG: S1 RNA-binding domain-containing protein [bacterium]|nr:S1 RNA-binding domain-containing protein [bacterium]
MSKVVVDKISSKMADLLAKEEYSPKVINRGQVVEGLVVAKYPEQILVDVGAKAEGIISSREIESEGANIEDMKVGDKILVYVVSAEGENGQAILSLKKTGGERRWITATKKMETGETASVKVLESNRGGVIVDFDGVRGFIPSSHLVTPSSEVMGRTLEVKVIEVDKKLNRLVFSEKEAHPERALPKVELPFKEGDKLDGEVTKMLPFGFLVSLPSGVEGLVHISEVSWERVGNLAEMYKVGEKVKVKVVSIDPSSGKVNLSIKQLLPDPWQEAESKYPIGKELDAEISRTSSYGAFVQLESGIEGLIHSSKIPYGTKLEAGSKVHISVDIFDAKTRRVALRLVTKEKDKDLPALKAGDKPKKTKKG